MIRLLKGEVFYGLTFVLLLIILFMLIVTRKRNEVLIFSVIILVKSFVPFIDFNENITVGTYSIILLLTIIFYFFLNKDSYIDKISSLILSLIIFLVILIGEILFSQRLQIIFGDKYILYGSVIGFVVYFLDKANITGYIGSMWGILLFEYSKSYYDFRNSNSKIVIGSEDTFSIAITSSIIILTFNIIQSHKSKPNDTCSYNSEDEKKNELLKLIIKDKEME